MELKQNMLLQFSDGKIIRIIFCDRLSSIIYVVDMDALRWPYVMKMEVLYSLSDKGEIDLMDEDIFFRVIAEEELSDAESKRRDTAWEIVNHVLDKVENEKQLLASKYRERAIKDTLESYKVNYTTVKNYLIRYWKGGKTRNALLPNFHLSGAKGKEKNVGEKKRGRPRKSGSKQGVNIDGKIKKYFKIGLNRYYYNERQNSLKATYELILKDFFTEEKMDHEGRTVPVIMDPTRIPTYHQFLYWYKQINNPKKELISRKGTRNYFQNYRAIIGDSTQDAGLGPGSLWQIDATPFDIYLVSSSNRNIIVGRPILYLVVDVYSRYIVGMNISFEPFNSYTGVMVALANSMSPKEDYCKQYGISLDKGEWDVACVPQRIFADRGELNGKQIESAIEGLGISILNAPAYRADYKGVIEQAFAQLNIKVKPFADGIVKNGINVVERGDEEYRLKANLTLNEFNRVVIKCVLFHNNHHVLNEYVLDEMMISEEVEKVPSKIWDYGMKNMKGQLRTLPENIIKLHLLPTAIGSITSRGLKYMKMLYASDYTLKNNWFQNARIDGSRKIKIWYDPRDLSHIYVINEDGEFHKLTLLEHLTKFKNKGIEEINQIIEYEESLDSKSKDNELQAKMKLFDDIEDIVGKGRKKTKAEKDDSLSKTRRLKGIRENQQVERELQRNQMREINDTDQNDYEVLVDSNMLEDQNEDLGMFSMLQKSDWSDEG